MGFADPANWRVLRRYEKRIYTHDHLVSSASIDRIIRTAGGRLVGCAMSSGPFAHETKPTALLARSS